MSDGFEQYLRWRSVLADPPVELDLSQAGMDDAALQDLAGPLRNALQAMQALEEGAIANPDEGRQVGHYWLRAPGRAPAAELSEAIQEALTGVEDFARRVRTGDVETPEGAAFQRVLVCGIGGSALGPMLLADAFAGEPGGLPLRVLDNTDPEGITRALEALGALDETLVLVISKSGGTPETRNAMMEVEAACKAAGLDFARRAVAVTGEGSKLYQRAEQEGWLGIFPMWDWVGGRTSLFSAVGLLPAALMGIDIRGMLAGAAAMDDATRVPEPGQNMACLMAAFWWLQGGGKGERAMVVLPYKDRLQLFSRYLQQLVMESLGKRLDRQGQEVCQGLTVYGNKGSTDQHAYVQQLRDGLHDFFCVFIRVLNDLPGGACAGLEVDAGVTTGDFLDGFWQGTREALAEAGRASATLEILDVDARSVGALIALFERAVGIYAELCDINAYHQPGVEAGKQAAAAVLERQAALFAALPRGEAGATCRELAAAVGAEPELCWPILRHLAANRAEVHARSLDVPDEARFRRL